MADEDKKDVELNFTTAEELNKFLMDLQGQIVNMQETVDKLTPVDTPPEDDTVDTPDDEELSDEELSEIDRLLQSE